MILEELIAILGFEERGADSVERFKGRLESARSTAAGVAKAMVGIGTAIATAAVAATGALFKFVTPVAQEFDALIKQADRLSVSFEALQALGFAAEQSGGSVQGMASSLAQMDRRLAEAARGTGRAKQALEDYGLAATNAAGEIKRADEFLLELAEVFETLSTQQQLDLGRQLGLDEATITLLQQGRAGIEALTDEARELGLVMSEEAARGAEEFNDQMNRLQRGFRALRQRLALDLLPTMTQWMRRLDDWFRRNRDIIQQRLDQALRLTVAGIEAVGSAAMAAGRSVSWLSEQLEKLTGVGAQGQLAMLGAGAAALLATRHPVLAALAALLLILDDIRAFTEGEDSAIGWALDWLRDSLNELGVEFESWSDVATAAIEPVVNEFRALRDIIQELIDLIPKIPEVPRIQLPGDLGEVRPGPLGSGDLGGLLFNRLGEAFKEADHSRLVDALGVWWRSRNSIFQMLRDAIIGEAGAAEFQPSLLAPFGQIKLPALSGDTSGVMPATVGAPDPLSDLLQPLLRIDAGLQQISSGIESFSPGDTINNHTRNVDFDQVNNITINQNVSGEASAAAAGSAAGSAVGQAGRRAADIAAQEPGIDSLPPI